MTFDQLSDKYSVRADTIAQRASRYGWKCTTVIARKEAKRAVQKAVRAHISQGIAEIAPALKDAIQEWQDNSKLAASKIVRRVSESLEDVREPEDLVKCANALDRADIVGRRAMGLDKDTQPGGISLHVSLGVGTLSGEGKPGACLSGDYSDAIDVVSTPVSNGPAEGEN